LEKIEDRGTLKNLSSLPTTASPSFLKKEREPEPANLSPIFHKLSHFLSFSLCHFNTSHLNQRRLQLLLPSATASQLHHQKPSFPSRQPTLPLSSPLPAGSLFFTHRSQLPLHLQSPQITAIKWTKRKREQK